MLSINTNISSYIAQRSLHNSTQLLNQAIERMSTGSKLNHAKNNAANYGIVSNMGTKLSAYQIAEDNAMMGLDMIQTASSSLSQMSDLGFRLRALCTQALNNTYGSSSISAINSEARALISEIQRLSKNTKYNGINLLNAASDDLLLENIGASEDVIAKAEYNNFIANPFDYTDAEVAAMTSLSSVSETTSIYSGKYSISSADELAQLARMTNSGKIASSAEFVLASDIDLSDYSTGDGWTPIGTGGNSFNGTFNGNGHTISNLYIENNSNAYWGLFGFCGTFYASATIKNVGIVDCDVLGRGDVGGLAGHSGATTIDNCYVTGNIAGGSDSGSNIGGLAGFGGTINNCYSTCSVRGGESTGGLAGDASTVTNCYSTGNVSGNLETGGLLGSASTVTNCYATGNVSGSAHSMGGLVGGISRTITNCHATGSVTSGYSVTGSVGGLVGNISTSFSSVSIMNSYSSCSIKALNSDTIYCGGLVGSYTYSHNGNTADITNCFSSSSIESDSTNIGSFLGKINLSVATLLSISDCGVVASDFNKISGVENSPDYDLSPWLAEIRVFTPPSEKAVSDITLQVGINSASSSQIICDTGFNTTFFDDLSNLKMENPATLQFLDDFLQAIDEKQTQLGAIQNRLESALDEISTHYENLTSSRSTLRDADIAKVSSEYICQQILQQASATLMATANQTPSIALQLL